MHDCVTRYIRQTRFDLSNLYSDPTGLTSVTVCVPTTTTLCILTRPWENPQLIDDD